MGLREDAIAAAKKPRVTKPIDGTPWGLEGMHVLKISGLERDQYQQDVVARLDKHGRMTNPVGWKAKVVVMFACDENGKKIFKPEDAAELNQGDPEDLDLVFEAFREFNGMREEDEEELSGNSESGAGCDSSSASHLSLESQALNGCLSASPMTT